MLLMKWYLPEPFFFYKKFNKLLFIWSLPLELKQGIINKILKLETAIEALFMMQCLLDQNNKNKEK